MHVARFSADLNKAVDFWPAGSIIYVVYTDFASLIRIIFNSKVFWQASECSVSLVSESHYLGQTGRCYRCANVCCGGDGWNGHPVL